MSIRLLIVSAATLWVCAASQAGPYTANKNNACPEAWEVTAQAIPVLGGATDWADNADRSKGLEHISSRAQLNTIDALPVNAQDKVDDVLTVDSECLVYRNFEVDTFDYSPPVAEPLNASIGWLLATY